MESRSSVVSRLVNELRSLNKDEYYNRRSLLSLLEDKAVFLLSQKLGDKSLYRESNIYSTIRCFEMENQDIISCLDIEFKSCKVLMKGKHKLPQLINSKYGSSVLSVTSLDDGKIFTEISFKDYVNIKKRKYGAIPRYVYIIRNDEIFIPDWEVRSVNIDLLTIRTEQISEKSGCSEDFDCCKSYWEYPLINSDKLKEAVFREVLQEAVGTYRNIQIDENPNKDSNIKSKTTI